ncbi:hypothetical protein [Nocardioides ferulae]|uniref:hypothetical protein n=1 Tax=Nocardioides ferulae TaxID=2340821 RepID=UPI000EAC531D|nr:hypothetical protein [Nocardioides ferulae]
MSVESRQVFLHVGMPKTGTTFVQSVLHASRDQLHAQGVALLPQTRQEHFWVGLDVRGVVHPEHDPPRAQTALERFRRSLTVVDTPRVLFSDELVGGAGDESIGRFVQACGDAEVHVIVTVRSLSRLLPSAWQQRVQDASPQTFDDFLAKVRAGEGWVGERFRANNDVRDIIARWSQHVPLERIHVVTMPGAGQDPRSLLQRFCDVVGVDPEGFDEGDAVRNPSLGRVQAELLRAVNQDVPKELRSRHHYVAVSKRWLTVEHLTRQESQPVRLPAEAREWCADWSQEIIDFLRHSPVQVVGDLDDLRAPDRDFEDQPPVTAEQVADSAIRALRSISLERVEETAARRAEQKARREQAEQERRARAAAARAAAEAAAKVPPPSLPRRAVRKVRRVLGG